MEKKLDDLVVLLTQQAERLATVEKSFDSFKSSVQEQLKSSSVSLEEKLKNLPVGNNGGKVGSKSQVRQVTFEGGHCATEEVFEDSDADRPCRPLCRVAAPWETSTSHGFSDSDPASLQASFRAVHDSWSRVRLPDDLVFTAQRQGINKEGQEAASVIQASARYVETALKLTGSVHSDVTGGQVSDNTTRKLEDLTLSLVTCMRFLQEDYASLVMGGVYGSCTKHLFRSLGSNASAWSNQEILAHVKTAADLAAIKPEETQRPGFHGWQFQCGSTFHRGHQGG